MMQFLTSLFQMVAGLLPFIQQPNPDAELQALLEIQRHISDEIARRRFET